ncbi:MAG: helix-turn-helix domain-containing protein [Ruminococcus flavefaciens]|nr:helix-turn-helix domain-containing protein [Ruminococcus flavefaciens]
MESLATRIQTCRKVIRLTQEEFAKKTETTRSTVAQWENGLIVPTLAQLEKICKALECKSIDILGF